MAILIFARKCNFSTRVDSSHNPGHIGYDQKLKKFEYLPCHGGSNLDDLKFQLFGELREDVPESTRERE